MAVIVADTDVVIDALHGRQPSTDRIDREVQTGALATTAVTAFELLDGAREEGTREAVTRLLAALDVLPFDEDATRAAAGARRALEERGEPIGLADYLIAGICVSRSAPLLTRDHSHFRRISGLLLSEPRG